MGKEHNAIQCAHVTKAINMRDQPTGRGTVASQSAPMTKLNTTTVLTVMGVKMNQAEITTRAAYTLPADTS